MDGILSLAGQRAIVTGAGRGLGRAYALELGRRGAKVVVNDIDRTNADEVAKTVRDLGGEAVCSYEPVGAKAAGQAIVDVALRAFGGLDILINNAGFLRPAYFEDMTEAQITSILDVHLLGSIYVTQAAWPVLQRQTYGRVVMTSSAAGMLAHPAMANYSAAKAGVFGLMKALAYEGERYGIKVNALLPYARSEIIKNDPIPDYQANQALFVSAALQTKLDVANRTPERVAPMAVYLASPECEVSGEGFSVCAGRYARMVVAVSDGWLADRDSLVTAETIRDHLAEIRDISRHSTPKWLFEEVADVARRL